MLNEVKDDWRVLIPGEEVPIPGTTAKITVYPLGLDQIKHFQGQIEAVFAAVKDVDFDPAEGLEAVMRKLTEAAVPVLVGSAFQALSECCVPSLKGAPLFVPPLAAEACIRQTFGGGRLNPLKAVVEKLVKQVMGGESLSALLSRISSRPGTESPTSQLIASPDLTGSPSLTPAGQSPNSSTT